MKPAPLPVCLTADIEFEIRGALTYPDRCTPVGVDSVFRSSQGRGHGLDALLAPLIHHSLPATFFVETLQGLHFGIEPMHQVVERLKAHDKIDIQLHAHPCWTYLSHENWRKTVGEIRNKNDSMAGRSLEEAKALLASASDHFISFTGRSPDAFRSGGLRVDLNLMTALSEVRIGVSSCVGTAYSPPHESELRIWSGLIRIGSVTEIPVTSYTVAFGPVQRPKLLTVTGTPFSTMKRILDDAYQRGAGPVVFLTHASEMAADVADIFSPPAYSPICENQRRWSALCAYLASNSDRFRVKPLGCLAAQLKDSPTVSSSPYKGGLADIAASAVASLRNRV